MIEAGALRAVDDVPERFHELLKGQEVPNTRSCILAPGGDVLAAAPPGEEAIVLAHGALEAVLMAKARCDVGGHYARPDVLQLLVHGQPLERVIQAEPVGAAARAAVHPFGMAASTPVNGQETDPAPDRTAVR